MIGLSVSCNIDSIEKLKLYLLHLFSGLIATYPLEGKTCFNSLNGILLICTSIFSVVILSIKNFPSLPHSAPRLYHIQINYNIKIAELNTYTYIRPSTQNVFLFFNHLSSSPHLHQS